MINNYKQEHASLAKQDRIFTISYLCNVVISLYFLWRALFGTGMINQLPPLGRLLAGVVVGLLSVNVYFLLSKADWKNQNRFTQVGSILTFIVVTALLIKLDFTSCSGTAYGIGAGFGRGFVVALSAMSIVEVIWLYPQFKQRRNR